MRKIRGNDYFCYDDNGNMDKRRQGGVTYNQTRDVENRLTAVTIAGLLLGNTTYFQYDAAGQRVRTELAYEAGVTYYPFPGYEEEVSGGTTTRRTTYTIAGQAVAVRVVVVGGNNNVLHLHIDHLGSNSVMSYSGSAAEVGGSRARYLPFGAWRTAPTQSYTDRGYTGQLEDMELGLYHYNARYYIPSIGRFASADTIVPNPGDPQSHNRYAYVRNNPVIRVDPTGHIDLDAPEELSAPPNPWELTDTQMDLNSDGMITGDEAARADHHYQSNADSHLLADFTKPAETGFGTFGGPRTIGCGGTGEPDCSATRHPAVDGGGRRNSDIYAIGHGRIVAIGNAGGGFGEYVVIEHDVYGVRLYSVYAHLQPGSVRVQPGYTVEEGARIGGMGDSGGQTDVHLHFEIRRATNVDLSQDNPFDGQQYWPDSATQLLENFVDLGPIFGYNAGYADWTENNP